MMCKNDKQMRTAELELDGTALSGLVISWQNEFR